MSQQNLATVATDLIESYGNTAKNVISAYRVGNERAVSAMEQRWQAAVMGSGKRLSEEVRSNALSAQKKLGAYYIKGIEFTTQGADTAVSKAVELAAKGVQQVAANANKFEKATGNTTLNKIAVAAVPAAVAVSKVAGQVEKKTGLWVVAAAGNASEKPAPKTATAKRRTAKAAAAA